MVSFVILFLFKCLHGLWNHLVERYINLQKPTTTMSKKKKYTNWARYENGRDNELRRLVMTLKDVIYSLDPPYEMKWSWETST